MGTRNLTAVFMDGEYKVAQYGQWDGYPSGQGVTILDFLNNAGNIINLKANLKKARFIDDVKDKEFMDAYNTNAPKWSNEPDNRTPDQIRWFRSFMTRDLGGKILGSIADAIDGDEILLRNSISFAGDSLMCEYAYVVDFDKNTFEVYEGFNQDDVDESERFFGVKNGSEEYSPVKLVKSFMLNLLPTEKEFLEILEPDDEDEE